MASSPNFNALLMQGFQTGREMKRQEGERTALAGLVNGEEGALGNLATYNPQMAFQAKQHQDSQALKQQEMQAEQMKRGQEQMVIAGKLLEGATDESTYQQSLAAARQYGIDVSKAPPSFDPQWVNQQRMIVNAMTKDGGSQISGIARELQDAGYKPGTPEFAQAMVGVINNKYASDYVDEAGNTRRRSALNVAPAPSASAPAPRPSGMTDEQLKARALEAVRNGANIDDVMSRLQSWGVKP